MRARCDAKAEIQVEAVKLEVLQSGEASLRGRYGKYTLYLHLQVRIEFQLVSKQLLLECKERAHVGTFILIVDRYTLWSLIGLSSG